MAIAYCADLLSIFCNFSGTKEGEYMLKMVDENGTKVLRKVTEADPALHTLIQNTVKYVRFFRCKVNTRDEDTIFFFQGSGSGTVEKKFQIRPEIEMKKKIYSIFIF